MLVRLVAIILGALLVAPAASLAASANDNFANAFELPSQGGVREGDDSTGATEEPGEPDHWLGISSGKSIWYRWTPPFAGNVEIDLCGSFGGGFGPVLAVYTGSAVNALTLVKSDTSDVTGVCPPRVFFDVLGGVTYSIAADGLILRPQQEGPVSIHLRYSAFPSNPSGRKKKCKKGRKLKRVKGKLRCVKKKKKTAGR